jgi:hypothetical protein
MARSANEEDHHQPYWADGRTVAPNLPRADSMNLSSTADAIRVFHAVQIRTEARPAFGVQEMSRLGIPAA